MEPLLILAILINTILVFKLFSKKTLIFITGLLPLFQVILIFIRYQILPKDFEDPTVNFPISKIDAYNYVFVLSILILLFLVPFLIFIKRSKYSILNYEFNEIIALAKHHHLIVTLFASSYPLWVFTQEYMQRSILDYFISLIVRLFGAAWLFVPILPFRDKLIVGSIFISSLPIAIYVGNRTAFIFPLILLLIYYFLEFASKTDQIFSNIKSIFKFFIGSIFIFASLSIFIIISIIIRFNRELKGFDFNAIISRFFDLDIGNNIFVIAFSETFDRLIQWQILTSLIVDKISFSRFFNEYIFIFSSDRYNWDLMMSNEIGLGLVQLMGIDPTPGYSWPVTVLAEGALRFGYFGLVLFYFLFLVTLIATIELSKKIYIRNFFTTLYFLTATLINFNADSLPIYFKTSFQFLILSFSFLILYKFCFFRLDKRNN